MSTFHKTVYIERGPLLNFWISPFELPHPITGVPYVYKGAEWRFQACKVLCMLDTDRSARIAAHDSIAGADTARFAKQLGSAISIDPKAWDRISYPKMTEAALAKFQHHEDLRQALLDTGFARLVEHRPDPVWGDNLDGSGSNGTGKALMWARASLRREFGLLEPSASRDIEHLAKSIGIVDSEHSVDVAEVLYFAEEAVLLGDIYSEHARRVLEIADTSRREI